MKRLFLALFVLAMCGIGRTFADEPLPRFDAFPVENVFNGQPAKVKIISARDRKFATRLRQLSGQKPNYAGHYTLASWGCGASCIMTVAIDAKTGGVIWLPFTVCCWDVDVNEPIEFRRDSSLIVVHGSRNETGGGTYYYRLEGSEFVLVKAVEKTAS
ncbi:hypothetical protein PQR14_21645 [Paraburkholderia bryophila]|uniref:hypothetical protein n=1 Tax=Burkholderiaceae TaxID=119060 RepID=UPI0005532B97|nr:MULTISPECIES: hypothetical protein [Burkholderiaceae]